MHAFPQSHGEVREALLQKKGERKREGPAESGPGAEVCAIRTVVLPHCALSASPHWGEAGGGVKGKGA